MHLPVFSLGRFDSLHAAVDALYDLAAMRRAHPSVVCLKDWEPLKKAKGATLVRYLQIEGRFPDSLPDVLRLHVKDGETAAGGLVNVMKQMKPAVINTAFNRVQLETKLKPRILCGKLLKIKVTFTLDWDADATREVRVSTKIHVGAVVPPPLNRMAEEFVLKAVQEQVELFTGALSAKIEAI